MSEDSQNTKKTAIDTSRLMASVSAVYYGAMLSLFYKFMGYITAAALPRTVFAASCFPIESAVFAGTLAALIFFPASLFWFGKVAQGVAAFMLVPLIAAFLGYAYYLSLLLSPSCGWW